MIIFELEDLLLSAEDKWLFNVHNNGEKGYYKAFMCVFITAEAQNHSR